MLNKKKNNIVNIIIKALLFFLLLYVIYRQIFIDNDPAVMLDEFLFSLKNSNPLYLVLAFVLLIFNIVFEALKWRYLVSFFAKISLLTSIKTVLVGIAMGIVTPARFGEYFGRVLLLDAKDNWKGAWANFISSIAQSLATLFFGVIGLSFLAPLLFDEPPEHLSFYILFAGFTLFLFLLYFYYHIDIALKIASKIGLKKITAKIETGNGQISGKYGIKILNKVLILAFLRYMVFSVQYFLVLTFFGIRSKGLGLFYAVFTIFLIQTGIPLPGITDLFARSEIAILVLQHITTNKIMILSSTFSLWIINLLIPAVIGMILISGINITKSYGYE